jgi:mevalonate kinase
MEQSFYSNGKLLITSEYVVLDGAKALALPTKYGQSLHIFPSENESIHWKSIDHDGSLWFADTLPFSSIVKKERFDDSQNIKNTLIEILHECYKIDSTFITSSKGYSIETRLTFPRMWGLGTSSTLLNNLAQWLQIDAFVLLQNSFGGSGYDIACAQHNSAILYQIINQKPVTELVHFNPSFTDKLFFVYLNQKKNSREAIANYYNKQGAIAKEISFFSKLTETILTATVPQVFAKTLQQHEIALSHILELETVQELLFKDFNGVVKSLGAWGGDFVMVFSSENPTTYFNAKGFDVVIPYSDMIL